MRRKVGRGIWELIDLCCPLSLRWCKCKKTFHQISSQYLSLKQEYKWKLFLCFFCFISLILNMVYFSKSVWLKKDRMQSNNSSHIASNLISRAHWHRTHILGFSQTGKQTWDRPVVPKEICTTKQFVNLSWF